MPAEVIDTLEIAHELRSAGLTEPQAEAIARQFKRRYEADRQELVTREYLDAALDRQSAELRVELGAEIGSLRAEVGALGRKLDSEFASVRTELRTEIASVRTDIARLERDLILKLGGIVTLAVAVVGAPGVLF